MNEQVNVLFPGWQVIRRLGSGSFGTVYEIQRDVYGDIEKAALKVIKLPRSEDEVDYLRCTGLDDASITMNFHQQVGDIAREYKLMAQMRNNPNVVRCDDFRDIQHDDGLGWDIYIKMELLSPLMKNLDTVATEPQIIQLGKDICNALIACQEKNIIHRDIKPQNVFVSETGVFKLGDFGIARTIERTTHATAGIGTYSYMAPEVEKNQPYGRPADIYSLGLMMYWLLNERRGAFMPLPPAVPGYGDEEAARQRRFSGEPVPAPRHGSDALKAVVLKACAFDPNDRYQTAQEMWNALDALGGAIPAPAPMYEEEMTVGPGMASSRKPVAAPVVAPAPQPEYDDEMTVGPGTEPSRKPVAAPVVAPAPRQEEEFDDEKTVGPAFNTLKKPAPAPAPKKPAPAPKKPAPAPAPKKPAPAPKQPAAKKPEPVKKEKSDKKSPVLFIVMGAVIVILVLLLAVVSCDNGPSNPTPQPPAQTTAPTETTPETTEATEATEPSTTAPVLGDWSAWTDELPADITAENYDIEEKTLYSSRNLETTSSSNKTMEGWELFDTVEAGFGPWSSWSTTAVKESNTREVQTKTQYRYKETTTSNSSSKPGWTQYGTPTSSWGSWSSWSTSAVSQNSNRKVETRKEYRYRNVSSGSGYSDWSGWSQWSTTNPGSSNDLREVETRTVTTMSYFYYQCNGCGTRWYTNGDPCTACSGTSFAYRTGSGNLIMDPILFMDSGYYYSNDGSGMVFMNSPNGSTQTQYRYRTRTQLSGSTGNWSSWGTTPYTTTSTREVESRTVYRYCDKVTTYSFYRWTSWSDKNPGSSYDVETTTAYRYRDKVSATTYYFRRWTEWSDFSDSEVTASDTVEVKTQKQYRYKAKSAS